MAKWPWRVYLVLCLVTSCTVFYYQILNSDLLSDEKPIFSIVNKISLVILGLAIGIVIILIILDFFGSPIRNNLWDKVSDGKFAWFVLGLLSLVLIESGQDLILFYSDIPGDYYPVFLIKNRIFFVWTSLISLLSLVFLLIKYSDSIKAAIRKLSKSNWIYPILIGMVGLMLILFTGRSFIPRASKISSAVGTFETTNTPLPIIQILIIWLVVFIIHRITQRIKKFSSLSFTDLQKNLIVLLLLWSTALLIWASAPITPNYFIDKPRPPNYQNNVLSDSIYYEVQAHRLLAGENFSEDVQHPLYSFILAGFHLLGGDHFQDIFIIQIAILAITPFILYKISSLLLNQFSGWLTALFYIAREYNALILGDSISVTNVQQIMTESIVLMGCIFASYLIIVWVKKNNHSPGLVFLIGCTIGFLALIRIELLSLSIVFAMISLLNLWKTRGTWLQSLFLLIIGIVIIIFPWMFRNYSVSGEFYLDKNKLIQRTVNSYTSDIFQTADRLPSSSISGGDTPVEFQINNINKIWLHSKNSFVQSILYLPSNHQPLGGLDNYIKYNPDNGKIKFENELVFSDRYLTSYIKSLPYWRYDWDGKILSQSIIQIGFAIFLISVGIWDIWKKNPVLAITPALTISLHVLIYAIFSRSGGRYIHVVDWVTLLYFSLGITSLSRLIRNFPERIKPMGSLWKTPLMSDTMDKTSGISPKWTYLAAGVLIIISISMPLVEALNSPKYQPGSLSERIEVLTLTDPEIGNMLNSVTEYSIYYGRALYPGFYESGEQILDDRNGLIPDSTQSRLIFYFVGMENIWVSLPVENSPDIFPHNSIVIIQGKMIRNTQDDVNNGLKPYLLASRIYLLEKDDKSGENVQIVSCNPDPCY